MEPEGTDSGKALIKGKVLLYSKTFEELLKEKAVLSNEKRKNEKRKNINFEGLDIEKKKL